MIGWHRFFRQSIASALSVSLFVYLFVVVIDPWDGLPLSPPLPRVPATSASRYTFPMLARNPRIDSAVIGTSTSRLLRPALLDRLTGAHFVNLSMDAATAYEETRLLDVFSHAHVNARFIVIGIDLNWCEPRPEARYTNYPFPEWLYEPRRWSGYRHVFNIYAVQESGTQLWAMLGLKRSAYPTDGYRDFGLPEAQYDLARAHEHIEAAGAAPGMSDPSLNPADFVYSTHHRLQHALGTLPDKTRKILYFVPFALSFQGAEGSPSRVYWDECKRRVAAMSAQVSNSLVIDFMIPSPITKDQSNYYDAIHYRPAAAIRLVEDMARAITSPAESSDDYRILLR